MAHVLAFISTVQGHAGTQKRPIPLQADHLEPVVVNFALPQNMNSKIDHLKDFETMVDQRYFDFTIYKQTKAFMKFQE